MGRAVVRFLAAVMLAWMVSGMGAAAQDASSQAPQIPAPGEQREHSAEDALSAEQRHQWEKQRNEQRQADIKKDTDKLLELATELKQYVDKSNENTLSLDVVKKAEQIEKLAKSVKEKMKGQ